MLKRGGKQIITIRIYAGDIERLERFFPSLKYNMAIRELLHQRLNEIEEKYNQTVREKAPAPKIEGTI